MSAAAPVFLTTDLSAAAVAYLKTTQGNFYYNVSTTDGKWHGPEPYKDSTALLRVPPSFVILQVDRHGKYTILYVRYILGGDHRIKSGRCIPPQYIVRTRIVIRSIHQPRLHSGIHHKTGPGKARPAIFYHSPQLSPPPTSIPARPFPPGTSPMCPRPSLSLRISYFVCSSQARLVYSILSMKAACTVNDANPVACRFMACIMLV